MYRPVIFMFAGQGSHYYQMGRTLFERNEVFTASMKHLDRLAQHWIGGSVIERLYDPAKGSGHKFDQTLFSHPAIYMVERSLTHALENRGIIPDAVIGAGIGEFAAASAAGILSENEAFEAVCMQAKAVESRCAKGGMLAILHHPDTYQMTPALRTNGSIAAVYQDNYFVISGTEGEMEAAEIALSQQSLMHQRLPVSNGFHSPAIDQAGADCRTHLQQLNCRTPQILYYSGSRGGLMNEWHPDYFWEVIRNKVRVSESLSLVINRYKEGMFIDLSPFGSMVSLMNMLEGGRDRERHSILTPFHQDAATLEKLPVPHKYTVSRHSVKENCTVRAVVFPGQGSQRIGMGSDLFDEFPEITNLADAILGYSIKELCLKDPDKKLNQTQYTQPALYTVNALMYYKKLKETDIKPAIFAGHSLGEYNALHAAGAFDFTTGLKLVNKRGELMNRASGGGMAAIIGLSHAAIMNALNFHGLTSIDVANFNTPTQIVIAGPINDIRRTLPLLQQAGAERCIPLRVSGAFHSRYMGEAQREFEKFLSLYSFHSLQIPVLANVDAKPYRSNEVKNKLSKQITQSVRWSEIVQTLMGMGSIRMEEIGPGTILSKMSAQIFEQGEPIYLPADAWSEYSVIL